MGIVIRESLHRPGIDTVARFRRDHAGHAITATDPMRFGECVVIVRVCAECEIFHVAHNDDEG